MVGKYSRVSIALACVCVAGLLGLVGGRYSAEGQTSPPLVERYVREGVGGGVTVIGNANLTCSTTGYDQSDPTFIYSFPCAGHQAETLPNRVGNDFTKMVYVDVDNDGSTFNSSEASFVLPVGRILDKAMLYWSGSLGPKCRGDDIGYVAPIDATKKHQVVLRMNGAERSLTADAVETGDSVEGANHNNVYIGRADITDEFDGAGSSFTVGVANVQASQGRNCHGGWGLVVSYFATLGCDAATQTTRRVSILDGLLLRVRLAETSTIGLVGAPMLAGTSQLGMIGFEGDRDLLDTLRVREPGSFYEQSVTDGFTGTSGNVFRSRTSGGVRPQYVNNFSVDAKVSSFAVPALSGLNLSLESTADSMFIAAFATVTTVACASPTGSEVLDAVITRMANAPDGASRYRVALTVRNARNGALYTFSSPSGHGPPGGSTTGATASDGVAVLAPYELRNPRGIYRAQARVGSVVAANAMVK